VGHFSCTAKIANKIATAGICFGLHSKGEVEVLWYFSISQQWEGEKCSHHKLYTYFGFAKLEKNSMAGSIFRIREAKEKTSIAQCYCNNNSI